MEKRKNETMTTILAIVVYVVGMSAADSISLKIGQEKLVTAVFSVMYVLMLLVWASKKNWMEYLGLVRPQGNVRGVLYFIPLLPIALVNVWFGARMKMDAVTTLLFIVSMSMTGILEEVIFRGMLFRMMEKDNKKVAVVVASVLFGIGHIVNLFNGSGREVYSTLLQILYATAIGLVFVLLFIKTGSIIPQILCHSILNSLSAFSTERAAEYETVVSIVLVVLALLYAAYIQKKNKDIW
ncbi:MAG: lysostaphin resistance A-like protein [Candidatus Ornithospirochaeta sp.]